MKKNLNTTLVKVNLLDLYGQELYEANLNTTLVKVNRFLVAIKK